MDTVPVANVLALSFIKKYHRAAPIVRVLSIENEYSAAKSAACLPSTMSEELLSPPIQSSDNSPPIISVNPEPATS